jgi:hypothetical protein
MRWYGLRRGSVGAAGGNGDVGVVGSVPFKAEGGSKENDWEAVERGRFV